jgi:hypothetical protein
MTTVTVLGSGYAAQKYLLGLAGEVFGPDRFNIVDPDPGALAAGESVLRKSGFRERYADTQRISPGSSITARASAGLLSARP